MKRIVCIVALSVIALGFSGCATVLTGTKQNVTLQTYDSKPAKAIVSGVGQVTLPSSVSVKKGSGSVQISVLEDQCTNASAFANSARFNPITLISIVSWDLGTTDFLTGAAWQYDDNIIVPVSRKSNCNS
ncbi:MAG: hypothetical protein LBF86_04315 [Helicobacteraceae bacterium]|jgi:hypothetical protein|nr:hypothetical protein [Helicobacteraceae bacterium]